MNSGIEVFFTTQDSPWSMPIPNLSYRVNVYGPTGIIIQGLNAPQGYVSIDLPPGTYVVTGNALGHDYPNYDSNVTLVTVCCGKKVCVKVIPRPLHECMYWMYTAFQIIANNPHVAPAVAPGVKTLLEPFKKVLDAIPAEYRLPEFRQTEARALLEVKIPKFKPDKK
jgi:hypothetical protein